MKAAIGILCGGKSRRMGKNKAELDWNGCTLLEHMIRTMKKTGRTIYLSVDFVSSLSEEYQEYAVEDRIRDCGPMGGIYSVLKTAREEAVFFCAVDMPYVDGQAIACLEDHLDDQWDGAFFVEEGRSHALCGIYKKSLLPMIEERLAAGDYRMRMLSESCRIKRLLFADCRLPKNTLWNMNTPQDYTQAIEALKHSAETS